MKMISEISEIDKIKDFNKKTLHRPQLQSQEYQEKFDTRENC